jgi:UDP-glucose 4-epimerase
MKVIVSGGAGFIGSHLVGLMLESGHKVTVLDNFSTGRPENLKDFKNNKNLKVVKADICDLKKILPYFKSVDWVFHIAALADIVPSIDNPIKYHVSNVDGTVNMLEAARHANVKRFIYAASSSCYGIPNAYPTSEKNKIDPRYPYALTKYIGEQCVLHWGKVYGLPVVSLRLFNVYGPRSRTSGTYGAVFGVFLAQKISRKPFTVVGDGRQTRDFVFVKDVARAFYMAAKSNVKSESINIGSGNTYSINRLTELLGGKRIYIPKRPGEPQRTHADIRKARNKLGWRPSASFEEGVRVMLDNIDYWEDAPVWTPKAIEKSTKLWFKYLGKAKR